MQLTLKPNGIFTVYFANTNWYFEASDILGTLMTSRGLPTDTDAMLFINLLITNGYVVQCSVVTGHMGLAIPKAKYSLVLNTHVALVPGVKPKAIDVSLIQEVLTDGCFEGLDDVTVTEQSTCLQVVNNETVTYRWRSAIIALTGNRFKVTTDLHETLSYAMIENIYADLILALKEAGFTTYKVGIRLKGNGLWFYHNQEAPNIEQAATDIATRMKVSVDEVVISPLTTDDFSDLSKWID